MVPPIVVLFRGGVRDEVKWEGEAARNEASVVGRLAGSGDDDTDRQ
jgi:hypothetical protein